MDNNKNKAEISLSVQYASTANDIPTRPQWRRWFKAALQHSVRLTLRVVDEAEGRELNLAYRHKDYATNVLTFVYDSVDELDDENNWVSGDVVICAPVIEREAAEQHKDLMAHYAHMAIHAALHLQGYDHEAEDEAEEMEALESQLMLKLKYPDPYAS